MRFPNGSGRLAQSSALVRPSDLPGTLMEWIDIGQRPSDAGAASSLLGLVRGGIEAVRDHLCMTSGDERDSHAGMAVASAR